MICPKCKTENPNDAKFCFKCGEPFEKETSTVEPQKPLEVKETKEKKKKKGLKIPFIVLLLIGIIGAGGYIFFGDKIQEKLLFYSAKKYSSEEKYDKAIVIYQKIIKISSQNIIAHKQLIETYFAKNDSVEIENAKKKYESKATEEPQNGLWIYCVGLFNVYKGKYDIALKKYNWAIEKGFNNAFVHNSIGYAFRWKKMYEKAEKEFKKGIEINPKYWASYSNLADLYITDAIGKGAGNLAKDIITGKISAVEVKLLSLDTELLNKAIAVLEEGIKNNPKDGSLYLSLAEAYAYKDKMGKAKRFWNKTHKIDKRLANADVGLGDFYFRQAIVIKVITGYTEIIQSLYEKSIACYEKAPKSLKKSTEKQIKRVKARLHLEKGIKLYMKAVFSEAIAELNKAIEYDPKNAEAYYNLGFAYRDNKDLPNGLDYAIEQFKTAVVLKPYEAEYHRILSNAYLMKGWYEGALEEGKKAVELAPKLAAARVILGDAYLAKGNFKKATSEYKQAIKLDPKNAKAQSQLEKIKSLYYYCGY